MAKLNLAIFALISILLSSCSVMAIQKHNPNFKSTRELEKAKGSFKVAEVKGGKPEMEKRLASKALSCRLTTFNMPADMTVSGFMKAGLTDEFDAARKLSEGGHGVTVVVNNLASDTASFDKGSWDLDLDYVVSNKTINVKTKTVFESAYMAETACRNTANALSNALEENFTEFFKKLAR